MKSLALGDSGSSDNCLFENTERMTEPLEVAEGWIKDQEGLKPKEAILNLQSKLYHWLDNKRQKGDKISNAVTQVTKLIMDRIFLMVTEITEQNIVLLTKIADKETHNKELQEIASKISRLSTGSVTEEETPQKEREVGRPQDFSVIISSKDADMDITAVKEQVREICKVDRTIPNPKDVVITKNNRLILRMRNRKEMEAVKDKLIHRDTIKDKININIPRPNRHRLLLLSVDPDIQEQTVEEALQNSITEMVEEEYSYRGFARKLGAKTIDQTTRTVIEELLGHTDKDLYIIKSTKTREGKNNWLIDVDIDVKRFLLNRKRICIDMERYRIVEFIPIIRCNKCQIYGHYAATCDNTVHCVKCSGEHHISNCNETKETCYNCYHDNPEGEISHRADSPDCPCFKKYRQALIPKRS